MSCGAWPPCHPFELVSCWRWGIIVYNLKYGYLKLSLEVSTADWVNLLSRCSLMSVQYYCSYSRYVFWDWFAFPSDTPSCPILLNPPNLPYPTENYCFNSRAKSCSECLQAGKGCAYCPEEVRAKNSRNGSSENSYFLAKCCPYWVYWYLGIVANLLQIELHALKISEPNH